MAMDVTERIQAMNDEELQYLLEDVDEILTRQVEERQEILCFFADVEYFALRERESRAYQT